MRGEINPHRPESDNRLGIPLVLANPPRQDPNPRQQLIHREGLGDVILSPGVEGLHLLRRPRPSRNNQDRRLGPPPHRLDDLNPVQTRHAEIQQDDVGLVIDSHLEGVLTIAGQQDLVSARPQGDPQRPQDLRVVVSNENLHRALPSSMSS